MCEHELLYVKAFEHYRITACECICLVKRGHFWSRDKDGGHTTESTIAKNPTLHANLMALSFPKSELWAIKVYIAGIGTFYLFLLWPWPWPNDLHINLTRISWRCKYKLPTSRLSKVVVWQANRQTDS